jgi:hypothetical protein
MHGGIEPTPKTVVEAANLASDDRTVLKRRVWRLSIERAEAATCGRTIGRTAILEHLICGTQSHFTPYFFDAQLMWTFVVSLRARV